MTELPTVDQVQTAVAHTSTAVSAIQLAWSDWAAIVLPVYLFIVQGAAAFKGFADFPGVKWLAGNWGHSTNAVGR
jgi:hypothetical protein